MVEIALFGWGAIFGGEPPITAATLLLVALVNGIAVIQWWRTCAAVPNGYRNPAPWTVPSIVIGQAFAIIYFVAPIWIEAHSEIHDLRDWLICIAAGAGLLLAIVVVTAAIAVQPVGAMTTWKALFLAVLPLAGSVQFWYTTIYRPAHERPDINIVASLEGVGPAHSRTARALATITLQNNGSTDIDFFDATYAVTGYGVSPVRYGSALPDLEKPGAIKVTDSDTKFDYRGVVQIGRVLLPAEHLTPGQTKSTSFVFAVDRRYFDKLRLTVMLSTLVDLGQSIVKSSPGFHRCNTFDIPSAGRIRAVLSDHPTAHTCIDYYPQDPPTLTTHFGYADSGKPAITDDLNGVSGGNPNTRGFTSSVEYSLADR